VGVFKTYNDVQKNMIREEFASGRSQVQLSKKYGVSRGTIQNYINGYYKKKTVEDKKKEYTMENWYERAEESYKRLSKRAIGGNNGARQS